MGTVTTYDPLLELDGVTSSYLGFKAVVDDVSFSVAPGEVVALVGPNGAGKTTLLNALSGIQPIDSGRVLLNGADVSRAPSWKRARLGMSRSFQMVRLFEDLSASKNIELGLAGKGSPGFLGSLFHLSKHRRFRTQAHRAADLALEEVGLAGMSARLASDTSHGQARRIELARAIVSRPSILLLDEPTSGLHAGVIGTLVPVIQRQAAAGVGVLLVEHNLRFVSEVATRVIVFDRGRVIADGAFRDVMRNPTVVQAYLGGNPQQLGVDSI